MKDHSNDPNWVLTKAGKWAHKNSLVNMQKAGQPTKNPKGRPKLGLTISEATRAIIESRDPKTGKKIADSVARKIVEQAMAGNSQFMQMLLDRVEGKVLQRQELTGAEGGPIRITAEELTDDELAVIAIRGGERITKAEAGP